MRWQTRRRRITTRRTRRTAPPGRTRACRHYTHARTHARTRWRAPPSFARLAPVGHVGVRLRVVNHVLTCRCCGTAVWGLVSWRCRCRYDCEASEGVRACARYCASDDKCFGFLTDDYEANPWRVYVTHRCTLHATLPCSALLASCCLGAACTPTRGRLPSPCVCLASRTRAIIEDRAGAP